MKQAFGLLRHGGETGGPHPAADRVVRPNGSCPAAVEASPVLHA